MPLRDHREHLKQPCKRGNVGEDRERHMGIKDHQRGKDEEGKERCGPRDCWDPGNVVFQINIQIEACLRTYERKP